MSILTKKNFNNSHFFSLIIIFIFSISVNFYYSLFGAFPIDTFLHYDSAYRILNNEYPVKDFWIVSGFVVDFIQSFFFKLFGVNFYAYIFHSSLFNCIISLLTYYFLISFKISYLNSTIYTLCFSTLAYTVSGTPFVDHHAVLFSLASTYLVVLALRDSNKNFWYFIVILFILSFLSKQVPATYIFMSVGVIVSFILIKDKKIEEIKIIFSTFVISLLFLILILFSLNINLKDFFVQYFQYPRSIGSARLENLDLSLESFFNKYKFLLLPILLIIFAKFKQYKNKFSRLDVTDNYIFLILATYLVCLFLHQILTKNQIFIYFLIPIFFALTEYEFKKINFKFKKYFNFFLIFVIILITLKYHFRYNENRKFHELEKVNFNLSLNADMLDKSLRGLKWINPYFNGQAHSELKILIEARNILNNSNKKIMLITNYLFLDSITEINLNYPNRTFTYDGASMPLKDNKFSSSYKDFLIKKIKKNKIEEIYFFKHEEITDEIITENFEKTCYSFNERKLFYVYSINCLN